jgi:hypothetical protein
MASVGVPILPEKLTAESGEQMMTTWGTSISSLKAIAFLHDWLQETGELYMDLDRPHSGGINNSLYFIDSLPRLKRIVSQETHPEVCICIFRKKQYPIRGIIGDALLATALEQIPVGQDFSILSPGDHPLGAFDVIGFGDSHDELRAEFTRLKGKQARIGQDPFDQPDTNFFEKPSDIFVARFYKRPEPSISKNRTTYSPFEAAPGRYCPHIDFW